MTPEQRYKIECMKDRTPGTNWFMAFIPLLVIVALLTKTESGHDAAVEVSQYAVKEVELSRDVTRHYQNDDPVCGGETWCFLGWRL